MSFAEGALDAIYRQCRPGDCSRKTGRQHRAQKSKNAAENWQLAQSDYG